MTKSQRDRKRQQRRDRATKDAQRAYRCPVCRGPILLSGVCPQCTGAALTPSTAPFLTHTKGGN